MKFGLNVWNLCKYNPYYLSNLNTYLFQANKIFLWVFAFDRFHYIYCVTGNYHCLQLKPSIFLNLISLRSCRRDSYGCDHCSMIYIYARNQRQSPIKLCIRLFCSWWGVFDTSLHSHVKSITVQKYFLISWIYWAVMAVIVW